MQERILVWDLPTRLFHWLLAASFAGAWLTAESEKWRDIHVLLGYTLAGLLVFRLVWGFVGSRYARFGSFLFPPAETLAYLSSLFSGSPRHYTGHNPAGALAIFALLILGAVAALSGHFTYESEREWLEELHEGAASAMLAVVGVHLIGVFGGSLLHRENLPRSMITGHKLGDPADRIRRIHGLAGISLLLLLIFGWMKLA
jgi:cytochrome b